MSMAFEISSEDVATVLQQNVKQIIGRNGRSLNKMAADISFIQDELDRIEFAALDSGDDLEEQTDGAYAEIKDILIERGILIGD